MLVLLLHTQTDRVLDVVPYPESISCFRTHFLTVLVQATPHGLNLAMIVISSYYLTLK